MARSAALGVAALVGLLLAACSGGGFYPSGVAVPSGDGVQTVSDAADALDVHRASASESAKAAIGAIDALGSFVRDISDAQRVVGGSAGHADARKIVHQVVTRGSRAKALRTVSQLSAAGDKRIISGSDLVIQPSFGSAADFCQSSAGYSVTGIPSLDVTFGWESGAFSGGVRETGERGFTTWSAHAAGEIVQGAIGTLSLRRSAGGISCPMMSPAFTVEGADVANAFSLPITLTFRRGELLNLSVAHATFANGESLDVTTSAARRSVEANGVVRRGHTGVATFHTNAAGDGTLTITSTGAQYVINDWVVVST